MINFDFSDDFYDDEFITNCSDVLCDDVVLYLRKLVWSTVEGVISNKVFDLEFSICKKFNIGHGRAKDIINQLQMDGIISLKLSNGSHRVLRFKSISKL